MSWRTQQWVVAARNAGRTLGLNKLIASYLLGEGYEAKYDNRFSITLRQGDCVWDIGANVGYYTRSFSDRVGVQGVVFAFEPSPANYLRLNAACATLKNVRPMQCGLGHENGKLSFEQGADELGATSRIVESSGANTEMVNIRSGLSLISEGDALPPNAIKIDVEGFELEVLLGFGNQLTSRELRSIGIEVHFGILKSRGMADAPSQIERLLHSHGFVVDWPDSSHILATRRLR
jgi:FkbM family methyltransferase